MESHLWKELCQKQLILNRIQQLGILLQDRECWSQVVICFVRQVSNLGNQNTAFQFPIKQTRLNEQSFSTFFPSPAFLLLYNCCKFLFTYQLIKLPPFFGNIFITYLKFKKSFSLFWSNFSIILIIKAGYTHIKAFVSCGRIM